MDVLLIAPTLGSVCPSHFLSHLWVTVILPMFLCPFGEYLQANLRGLCVGLFEGSVVLWVDFVRGFPVVTLCLLLSITSFWRLQSMIATCRK